MCFSPFTLYSFCLWSVDRWMHEPTVRRKVSFWCLFAWTACEGLAFNKLSCDLKTSVSNFWMTCHVSMSVTVAEDLAGTSGGMTQGLQPIQSWKGVKPVDLLIVFIRSKWILGKVCTQPTDFIQHNTSGPGWQSYWCIHSNHQFQVDMQLIILISLQSIYRVLSKIELQKVCLCLTWSLTVIHSHSTIYQKRHRLVVPLIYRSEMPVIECHCQDDR